GCVHDSGTPTTPIAYVPTYPDGWSVGLGAQFTMALDHASPHGGKSAVSLAATVGTPTTFATVSQFIRADNYLGRRVRWTAWVRPTGVTGAGAGAWMRVDGPGVTQSFDNMLGARAILGTSDWTQVSVVLDVPANAIGISFGVLLAGPGTVSIDDCALSVVGTDVPVTNQLPGPQASTLDSATVVSDYARDLAAPVNLDFEGIIPTGIAPSATSWLKSNAFPLRTVVADTGFADLAPLQQMIGSARLVGLGEATHGTREFFQMKHRVFEYLVRQMGFTYFAIEATWPEANDMNQYVLNGIGDPTKLLSHLYFWTWNTQEVLDFILWMRLWNLNAPPGQQVQFLGFDMQYPGAAMDTLTAFVHRVDPSMDTWLAQRYACLGPYRNHNQTFPSTAGYTSQPALNRTTCAAGLQDVFDLINTNGAAFQSPFTPGPAPVYANALHSARVVQQWEQLIGGTGQTRDQSMAENIKWLLDQAGPAAKMMLWAHNGHVIHGLGAMGASLRTTYGANYVNAGFVFGLGSFNAVGDAGTACGPCVWFSTLVPANSIEAAFSSVAQPLLLVDTRKIASGGTAAAPLHGPILMRNVGAVFSPAREQSYFGYQIFPDDYDLLIYVATSNPSTLLPFRY
ncbi:MAG: erythromycin esterase family protein, partial [Gemmatimonadales bacterium]